MVQQLSPDKIILSRLDEEGLGIFRNIALDLIEIWPEPKFPQDYPEYVDQIKSFIARLEKDGLIEINVVRSFGFYKKFGEWHNDPHNGFRLKNNPLYVHITKAGHDFVIDPQKNDRSTVVITGDRNQVIQGSSSSENTTESNKREKKNLDDNLKKWIAISISICTLVGLIWKGGEYIANKTKEIKTPPKSVDSLVRANSHSDSSNIKSQIPKVHNKKTTSVEVHGDNNITQGGNHNLLTVINPTQNNYITTGLALSKDSLNNIVKRVEDSCPIDMDGTHNVILAFGHASNGQRVFQQIESLLTSKGYHVLHGGPVLDTYFGVKFLSPTPPDCAWIVVGVFND